MNSDPMRELLQQADAAADPPPVMPPDLAARVRRRAWQQQRRRLTIGSAAAVLLLGVGLWSLWPRPAAGPALPEPGPIAGSDGEVAALRAEIARLRREADARRAVADALLRLERERAAQTAARMHLAALEPSRQELPPDPVCVAQEQVERAAATLVREAYHLDRDLNMKAQAAETYRLVKQLFPATPWARVAQHELARLDKEQTQGEPL